MSKPTPIVLKYLVHCSPAHDTLRINDHTAPEAWSTGFDRTHMGWMITDPGACSCERLALVQGISNLSSGF